MTRRVEQRLRGIDMMLQQMYVISPPVPVKNEPVIEHRDNGSQTANWRFEKPYTYTAVGRPQQIPVQEEDSSDSLEVKLKRITPKPPRSVPVSPRKRPNTLEKQPSVDFVPEHLIPYWDNRVIVSAGEQKQPHLRFRKP